MTRTALRRSCDRCHLAKLKCVFESSASDRCMRCQSRGVSCERSQSKPYGRTPGSRNNKQRKHGESKHEPRSAIILDKRAPAAGHCSSDNNASEDIPWVTSKDIPWVTSKDWYPMIEEPANSRSTTMAAALDPTPPPYDWLDTAIFSSIDDSGCSLPDYCSPLADFSGCASSDGHGSSDSATSSPDAFVCFCAHSAGEALSSLPERLSPSAAFDDVLQWTNSAASALHRFVSCDGLHDAATTVLFYFLVQNMLACYRDALHTSCAWPRPEWGNSSSNNDTQPGEPPAPQIRLGSYTIDGDGEDGAALRRQVVLLALRKVGPILQQLADKEGDQGDCCGGSCGGAGEFGRLYPLLRASLRADLDAAIKQASG